MGAITPFKKMEEENIEEQNSEVAGDANIETNEQVEETQEETLTVEDYRKLEAKNKELYQRAKKAEEEAKKLKTNKVTEPSAVTREEVILIAQGVPEEVISEAADYAKFKGISLKEAMKAPAIEALNERIRQEQRKSKAQLGASGVGGGKGVPDLMNAVGMTEEEHRRAIGM